MFEFVIFLLAVIGLAHIVADSTIFNRYVKTPLGNFLFKKEKQCEDCEEEFVLDSKNNKILKKNSWFRRRLVEVEEMMNCYQCSGFWSGVFVGLLWLLSTIGYMGWVKILILGFAGSYLAMLGATILVFLNTGVNYNDQNRHG